MDYLYEIHLWSHFKVTLVSYLASGRRCCPKIITLGLPSSFLESSLWKKHPFKWTQFIRWQKFMGAHIKPGFRLQSSSPVHSYICIHLWQRQPPSKVLNNVTPTTPICTCTTTVTETWCVGRLQVAGVTVIFSWMDRWLVWFILNQGLSRGTAL